MRLFRALPERYQHLARELLAFGFAGGVNTAFGFLLFNLLFSSMGSLWANAVATTGGTATSFVLNRHITYRHRPRRALRQELPLFAAVNLVGLGLQQGLMALAKVTFDLKDTDRLEFNLARVVSVAIGTLFLLLCYRFLVFRKGHEDVAEELAIEVGAPLPVSAELATLSADGRRTSSADGRTSAEQSHDDAARSDPGRVEPKTVTTNGRHHVVSASEFHDVTVPYEIHVLRGRPTDSEFDSLLPTESPDASVRSHP